jgi:hypothetical protein
VADNAFPAAEQCFSARSITRLLKEAQRVEKGKQVSRLLLVQHRASNVAQAYFGPHGRRMVPHRGRQRGRRKSAVHNQSEIGSDTGANSVQGVAIDAALFVEHLCPTAGIRGKSGAV